MTSFQISCILFSFTYICIYVYFSIFSYLRLHVFMIYLSREVHYEQS
nr:MAG TPA: hypothetical protein [Caudoviricetes sp.]